MRKVLIVACVLLSACSKNKSTSTTDADPAAFLKASSPFCAAEADGQAVSSLDKYDDMFMFNRNNGLETIALDLDASQRMQFNSKGQPKVKTMEKGSFRVVDNRLLLRREGEKDERESKFKVVTRAVDGKNAKCVELEAMSSIYCPCAMPEKN